MSYTNDAAIYKLPFTDGTFISMLNISEYDPQLGNGQHELIIPNLYMGDFDGGTYESTKYDRKGNKYVFSERGVVINDTIDFTRQASRLCLGYNPVNDSLALIRFDPIPEFIPSMMLPASVMDVILQELPLTHLVKHLYGGKKDMLNGSLVDLLDIIDWKV